MVRELPSWIERWQCPPSGWLKYNIDTAVPLNDTTMGVGVVVHDDVGRFVLGF